MIRSVILSVMAVCALAGCSFAPLRIAVQDVTLPASSSGGKVCYVRIDESAPAKFDHATYTADATYTAGSVGLDSSSVDIRIYGRRTAPAEHADQSSFCVTASPPDDFPLSGTYTLEPGIEQPIAVGGNDYGRALAQLITQQTYYLGAHLEGGFFLDFDQRIDLTRGLVSVYFGP